MEAFLSRETTIQRKNLTICTAAIVSRVTFAKNHAEHRAEQVLFQDAKSSSDKTFFAKVKREVIISSGAIGSPQILMLRSTNLSILCPKLYHRLSG